MPISTLAYLKLQNPHIHLSPQQQHLIHPYLDFMHLILGKLFIQGYRIFSKEPEHLLMIRRNGRNPYYCFVRFVDQATQGGVEVGSQLAMKCIQRIKEFSPDKPQEIGVVMVELLTYSTTVCRVVTGKESMVGSFNVEPKVHTNQYRAIAHNKELAMESKAEFEKLKWIINDYIDRVGEFKEFLIEEQLKACKFILSFDLRILLQTVNLIIAQQLLTNGGTQIQSYQWSQYKPSQGQWVGQRRDTIIKNGGRITVIQWLFLQQPLKHLSYKYLSEAKAVIKSYEDSFDHVEIVLYSLKNQIHENKVTYRWMCERLDKQRVEEERERFAHARKKKKDPEVIEILD